MNYGLIEDLIEDGAYVFGNPRIPRIHYRPKGTWRRDLPQYEPQAENYETSGCTVWGAQNIIETFIKGVYGYEPNYSENFTYLMAGIDPTKGTTPQNTFDTIRRCGLVDNALMPVPDTLEEFLDKERLTYYLIQKGQEWLKRYELRYAEMWNKRPDNYMDILREGLKSSPLGVSVTAWRMQEDDRGNLVYVSDKGGSNHFCVLFEIDEDGYPWIFDSYDHSIKRLSRDHNIRRAYMVWVNEKTIASTKLHLKILTSLLNLIRNKKSMIHPVPNFPVTQAFAEPNDEYLSGIHNGTDYACPVGTPILAPTDGEVITRFRDHATLGNAIHFMCEDGRYYMRFLHLSGLPLRGKYAQGDVIGYTGNTGQSHGPHLHVDVWRRPINTGLIKTAAGVRAYMSDPELVFRELV